MRKKIFAYYIILTLIGISFAGFFTSEVTGKFYKNQAEENLRNSLKLILFQLSEQMEKKAAVDFNKYASVYSDVLNMTDNPKKPLNYSSIRITFIDFKGNVLGESETDFKEMENHLSRKEIQEAINGNWGKDIRFSSTLKTDFLYLAAPIKNSEVVVRISIPLTHLKRMDKSIWGYTLLVIFAVLLLTGVLALRFSSFVTHPIDQQISSMTHELEITVADLVDKNLKMDSIINSMISGIVAVDRNFKIVFANSKACEVFAIKNGPGIIGINFIELIRNAQIVNLLKETINNNIPLNCEIYAGIPDEKILRAYTAPIRSKDNIAPNSGCILFIEDITNVKKLEQIRTEFVSNVTHELKTPLTSIRGFVETLRNGAINDTDVAQKFLEIVDIEAERLYILINDILQLSEIETKHKDSNIDTHNLKSIIDETISILQGVANKKNIALSSDVDGNISIEANKDRIKQMLINLIDNGIKYNVENGSVNIKAFTSEGQTVIIVEDTGIGISKEHLPRIFERFYRVDKGRSRNMGGTGLGLSIVKHIVNLYNGDLKVSSEPGKGTQFLIRLPK